MNHWTVYLLRCGDHSLYTGICKDLQKRVDQHNAGTGAKYTRGRGPCKIAWSKTGFTESEARKEEARLKRLSKAQKERFVAH